MRPATKQRRPWWAVPPTPRMGGEHRLVYMVLISRSQGQCLSWVPPPHGTGTPCAFPRRSCSIDTSPSASSPTSQRKDLGRSESLRVVCRPHRIFRPSDLIHGEVLGKGCFGQAIKVCKWGGSGRVTPDHLFPHTAPWESNTSRFCALCPVLLPPIPGFS